MEGAPVTDANKRVLVKYIEELTADEAAELKPLVDEFWNRKRGKVTRAPAGRGLHRR